MDVPELNQYNSPLQQLRDQGSNYPGIGMFTDLDQSNLPQELSHQELSR